MRAKNHRSHSLELSVLRMTVAPLGPREHCLVLGQSSSCVRTVLLLVVYLIAIFSLRPEESTCQSLQTQD